MPAELDIADTETATLATPFGWLRLTAVGDKLTGIDVQTDEGQVKSPASAILLEAAEQLSRYFSDPAYPLSLPLRTAGTNYQNRVWAELRHIRPGHTETYTSLATRTGSGPRAVAAACKANPYPIIVPCHRVLALHGLGGYCGAQQGPLMAVKCWLLKHEGVQFD